MNEQYLLPVIIRKRNKRQCQSCGAFNKFMKERECAKCRYADGKTAIITDEEFQSALMAGAKSAMKYCKNINANAGNRYNFLKHL